VYKITGAPSTTEQKVMYNGNVVPGYRIVLIILDSITCPAAFIPVPYLNVICDPPISDIRIESTPKTVNPAKEPVANSPWVTTIPPKFTGIFAMLL